MNPGELRFGVEAFRLDPPTGLSLDGYADRSGRSEGHLDPLMGRVCQFECDGAALTLVSLEVLGVSRAWARRAADAIRAELDDAHRSVIVAATHTHAGPRGFATYPSDRGDEVAYAERVLARTVQATLGAHTRLRPARVHVWPFELGGVASNRVDPAASAAGLGLAFCIRDAHEGAPLGYLLSVGCHATVLGADNTAYSGDLFGAASRSIEADERAPCVIVSGAAADVSTRFVRAASSHEEAVRLGRRLARAARRGAPAAKVRPGKALAVAGRSVSIPIRAVPTADEARAALARSERAHQDALAAQAPHGTVRSAWNRVLGARAQWQRASEGAVETHVPFDLTGARIGPGFLVTVPAEVPDATFQAWKPAAPHRYPWALATLANGYEGYFPVENVDAYEALVARFDADGARLLWSAAADLLAVLHEPR